MEWWIDLIILAVSIVIVLVIYKLISFAINRAVRSGKLPLDVMNGLRLLFRLIVAIIVIVLVINFANLPPEITIAISAIIGTAITFASIQGIQNFISGLYLIITNPFGVGDLISIGEDSEGVVSEISLNYTKITTSAGSKLLLANRNVLNSEIVNYTLDVEKPCKVKPSTLKKLTQIFIGEEITRYAFTLELPKDNPSKLKKILEQTVEEWKPKFGYKPEYIIWGLSYFISIRFILIADLPEIILKNRNLFIQDLYTKIYSKT